MMVQSRQLYCGIWQSSPDVPPRLVYRSDMNVGRRREVLRCQDGPVRRGRRSGEWAVVPRCVDADASNCFGLAMRIITQDIAIQIEAFHRNMTSVQILVPYMTVIRVVLPATA